MTLLPQFQLTVDWYMVQSLTVESVMCLIRSFPKLHSNVLVMDVNNDALMNKLFCNRKVFIAGHYKLIVLQNKNFRDVLWEQQGS